MSLWSSHNIRPNFFCNLEEDVIFNSKLKLPIKFCIYVQNRNQSDSNITLYTESYYCVSIIWTIWYFASKLIDWNLKKSRKDSLEKTYYSIPKFLIPWLIRLWFIPLFLLNISYVFLLITRETLHTSLFIKTQSCINKKWIFCYPNSTLKCYHIPKKSYIQFSLESFFIQFKFYICS